MTEPAQPATGGTPLLGGPAGALLALQELDLAIDAMRAARAALPELAELRAIEAEAAALERRSRDLAAERAAHHAKEATLATGAGELGSRIGLIEAQVRSGRVSYHDQEQLAEELASLARRRDSLEDEELAELTELDRLEQESGRLDAERPLLVARHRAARSALAAAEGELDRRIAEAGERRVPLADRLPPALLAEYEQLHAHLRGAAVVRVLRNSCSGCHLALPATEADRLRHAGPGSTARCEQCGRILVA